MLIEMSLCFFHLVLKKVNAVAVVGISIIPVRKRVSRMLKKT